MVVKNSNPGAERDFYSLQVVAVHGLEDFIIRSKLVEEAKSGEDGPKGRITTVEDTADLQEDSRNTSHGGDEVHEGEDNSLMCDCV